MSTQAIRRFLMVVVVVTASCTVPPLPGERLSCAGESDCTGGQTCGLEKVDGTLEAFCVDEKAGGRPPGELCAPGECARGVCSEAVCRAICTGSCSGDEACVSTEVEQDGTVWHGAACVPRTAIERIELPAVTTTETGSDTITFAIPPDTLSFTITAEDDDNLRLQVISLIAPDGTELIDLSDQAAELNPGTYYVGAASVLVPSTDAPSAAPRAGMYAMKLATYAADDFNAETPVPGTIERVHVFVERDSRRGGTVDLHIAVAPQTTWKAEDGLESEHFTTIIDRINAFLALAGLHTGHVMLSNLPENDGTITGGDDVRRVCAESSVAGPRGMTVNMFLVDELDFTSGFSGGIPGPVGVFGKPASGVVVEQLGTAEATGVLMSHELMHFLGLRHTTEGDGRSDAISDTPVCASMTAVEDCPDYTNLMFPFFPLRTDLTLTPGQVQVARGSPWAHDSDAPGTCAPRAVDVTHVPVHVTPLAELGAAASTCEAAAEAPQELLYRLGRTASKLIIQVKADADVVVNVLRGCAREPVACKAVGAGEGVITVENASPAPYVIIARPGSAASGNVRISVVEMR